MSAGTFQPFSSKSTNRIQGKSSTSPLPSRYVHHAFLSPSLRWFRVSSSSSSNSSSSSSNLRRNANETPTPVSPPIAPPDTAEIRFKRGSRKRRQLREDGLSEGKPMKAQAAPVPAPAPKSWEEMSMAEKVIELYMGEKGMLFWLNKFAYASIFIVIGAWILFRFVGPALNLYQLDSPPLSPSSMFKGS